MERDKPVSFVSSLPLSANLGSPRSTKPSCSSPTASTSRKTELSTLTGVSVRALNYKLPAARRALARTLDLLDLL